MRLAFFRWALVLAIFLGGGDFARAFVLMGTPEGTETGQFNYSDELGAPKDLMYRGGKRFFRWNSPHFIYSFDASFIQYFGQEGMDAVHDAFSVMNDFFVNEDYEGVTSLDLAKHGFVGNYNTTWINTTAKNAQIIDIKSIVLGMLVNQLGIGNPHRWAFSITGQRSNVINSQVIFETRLRNYDPITQAPSDSINGVKYSYRLIHNATSQIGVLPTFQFADMEEFTTDTGAGAWSSVAAITDAFFGNTSLWWTDTPSLFDFGVYYDGRNAMGGQFQPRHALTYDDAGGLKYLYSTNNYIFEDLPNTIVGIEPAQFLPPHLAVNYRNPSGRTLPYWPRRGAPAITPAVTLSTTFNGIPGITPAGTGIVGQAMRGGIDRIQYYHRSFDSLLGQNFFPTNFIWKDTFVYQNPNPDTVNVTDARGNRVGVINNSRRGIQWLVPGADPNGLSFWQRPENDLRFLTQTVGRNVTAPDLLFMADALPNSADGVPIGWQRPTNVYSNLASINLGTTNAPVPVGPGIISGLSGNQIVFNSSFTLDNNFEVIWSGEATVVGNQVGLPSLWGWIKGPGPSDMVTFPQTRNQWILENSVLPDVAPPTITLVSDDGGATPIDAQSLTRTEETLTLIGDELASVTAIEIMDGDLVVQTIMPAEKYVVSNQRIDIPAGIINDSAEGTVRTVRVWNTVGASKVGPQKFGVSTGRPVIGGTDYDNSVFDRAQVLTLYGYGFKSRTSGETELAYIRVDDSTGAAVDDNGTSLSTTSDGQPRTATFDVVSDTMAILTTEAIHARADGFNRRLRVSRKVEATAQNTSKHLSPATNPLFSAITTKPVINTLTQLETAGTWTDLISNGAYRRDRVLEINGTALNTATVIEVVQEDGSSFTNPVFIQLPSPGVTVDGNGTRMQISADSIPYADADTNSTTKRGFKIYNAVGNTDLNASLMFAVNKQPVVDGISGFKLAGHFNRDKQFGDDFAIFGSGLKAISQVVFTDANDTAQSRFTISLPSPGVTVTDTQISIDTSSFQIGSGADTDVNSSRRIVKLTSARDDALSGVAQRFYVGAPPTMGQLAAFGTTGSYRRYNDTLTITGGSGYGHVTRVEIVDANGQTIAGLPGLVSGADGTGGTGLNISNSTAISVDANASGWVTVAHLLDDVTAESRRVRITTPFGTVTSAGNSTGAFSLSATPEFQNTAQATFAGGGYTGDLGGVDDANGTYDKSEGDLVINGKNFRGVATVYFGQGDGANFSTISTVTINALAPPQGFSVNADGTALTIDDTVIPAGWIGTDGNYTIRLRSVGEMNATTQEINTQE